MSKKNILNIILLITVVIGLGWWNYYTQTTEKTSPTTSVDVKTLTPPVTSVPEETSMSIEVKKESKPVKEKNPDLEAKYKAIIKTGIPDKLISMILLFMEQRLEMAPDKMISLEPKDTDTATAFDLTWKDDGEDYKMHVEIDKVEAANKDEHYIYPYSLALWVGDKIKLQFTGYMNLNQPQPIFQDLDVIAYDPGKWEKNIKKLTITN